MKMSTLLGLLQQFNVLEFWKITSTVEFSVLMNNFEVMLALHVRSSFCLILVGEWKVSSVVKNQ